MPIFKNASPSSPSTVSHHSAQLSSHSSYAPPIYQIPYENRIFIGYISRTRQPPAQQYNFGIVVVPFSELFSSKYSDVPKNKTKM